MKKSSVCIAKERLCSLLMNDRMQCLSGSIHLMKKEIYHILKKYIEFTEDDFRIEIKRKYIIIYFTGEDS